MSELQPSQTKFGTAYNKNVFSPITNLANFGKNIFSTRSQNQNVLEIKTQINYM